MGQERLFRFPVFKLPTSQALKSVAIYLAGALYSLGFWSMIDAAIYSKTVNASIVHVTFVDWIPFVCSTMGMIIVNSIDKSQLIQSDGGFSGMGGGMMWQARIVLFVGFSLLAIGISGAFLVLILKFLIKGFNEMPTLGMGLENVGANLSVMFSCIVLWVVQNMEDDYNYSLAL
ncbi:hypothetical protein CANARDRAFT_7842 [[Candida] arabinofermentans NRRL YB-2248]|uniref:Vacuolar protein sorting-associated protein 68 n=1 Tax=[Candida] arabinofermentans NRRL YB-2248 TaxID=983967 RepID=A0A1E4T0B2_9ASCO|nr:hypothetical protein CANARDRAFT_7842 [[Candida] arabinofermentans NRRL YB-2248]